MISLVIDLEAKETIEGHLLLLELAALLVDGPMILVQLDVMTRPLKNQHELHGIPEKFALRMLNTLITQADRVVAHHINSDMQTLSQAYTRCKMKDPFGYPSYTRTYCTMAAATNRCKLPSGRLGSYKWPTLQEAYKLLVDERGFTGAHNALNDAIACHKLMLALEKGKEK